MAEHDETIDSLIERSSLGTPAAKALRERTPPEVVDRIMRKVKQRGAETATDTPRRPRCCPTPDIEAIWGLGRGDNNFITVACLACGTDLMVIEPVDG